MSLCDKNNFKYSAFNYGHTINNANRYINFSEGGSPILATLPIGSFTLGEVPDLLASALNNVGGQEYTVTLDRPTRTLTISAPGNFELLVATGSNTPQSFFTLAGFSIGNGDRTGSNSYTGDSPSGSQYITQTPLKNFINFNENKEKIDSVIRTTNNGLVEVISYGTLEKATFDLPFITNEVPQKFIRETATGKDELEAFMDYCIGKNPVEFLEDYREIAFTPCILDKAPGYSKGDGYKLRSLVTKKLKGYYELNGIVFRKIEV